MRKFFPILFLSLTLLFLVSGIAKAAAICDESNGGQNGLVPCGKNTESIYVVTVKCNPPVVLVNDLTIKTTTFSATQATSLQDAINKARGALIATCSSVGVSTASAAELQRLVCRCELVHILILIKNIYNFIILYIATPLAGLLIVIGGLMLLFSAGNPGLAGMAKRILWGAVIGIALIFGAWLIINIVLQTIGYSGAWSSPF